MKRRKRRKSEYPVRGYFKDGEFIRVFPFVPGDPKSKDYVGYVVNPDYRDAPLKDTR